MNLLCVCDSISWRDESLMWFFLSASWMFQDSLHCLNDLTGSESCVLFSQGGMTLAYDPTALQNGWVVCIDRLKTVPVPKSDWWSAALCWPSGEQTFVVHLARGPPALADMLQLSSCCLHTLLCLLRSFYSSPYSLTPNRMIAQTSLSPYMHSPVSSYQVGLFTDFSLPGWKNEYSVLSSSPSTLWKLVC